ncbi:esterase/lipase family protein [Streptomyces sp. NPDC056468]|uniref:esterase/lipase family protein n=1 Tax=Streptomyces sp. NPDC056468 TaxID=3345830 RepID=UPI0036CABFDA
MSYYDWRQSNATTAQQLAAEVDCLLAATGASKVDIVTHSMGGLSSRYYAKNLRGTEKIDAWVSQVGPNHGTDWANGCGYTSSFERRLGSTFLTSLNSGDESPGTPRYGTWWSPCHTIINPESSVSLSGAMNTRTACLGHIAVSGTRSCAQAILAVTAPVGSRGGRALGMRRFCRNSGRTIKAQVSGSPADAVGPRRGLAGQRWCDGEPYSPATLSVRRPRDRRNRGGCPRVVRRSRPSMRGEARPPPREGAGVNGGQRWTALLTSGRPVAEGEDSPGFGFNSKGIGSVFAGRPIGLRSTCSRR